MKYSEAIKLIKELSNKYSIYNNYKSVFELSYEYKSVAWVDKQEQFNFGRVNIAASGFNKLPYSHKLWMILSELTLTPLDERDDQPEFRLRLLSGESNRKTYLNQNRTNASIFIDDDENNEYKQTIFTESEYNRIRKYCPDWLPKFDENDKHFELVENK